MCELAAGGMHLGLSSPREASRARGCAGSDFAQSQRGIQMVNFKNACLVLGIVVAAAGCMTEIDGDTSSSSDELTTCREIQHFGYTYAGSTFNWDVTTDLYTGSQFVD